MTSAFAQPADPDSVDRGSANYGPLADADQPLYGLTVIDLGRALAAPHAAQLLGDLGATVIKVEPPGGDESRRWGSPLSDRDPTLSTYFMACNRNKRSIVLDLKTESGRDLLIDLVERADVLLENFRPGTLAKLGLAPERLREANPRLVILSITGFGHDGPESNRSGYDQIAQGEGGLMSLTGPTASEPYRVGVPIADLLAGIHGVIGVLAAVLRAGRTGRGDVVRTSLLAAVVGAHAFQGTAWTLTGQVPEPSGNHHPTIAPYGLFRCADSQVLLAVGTDSMWERFAAEFGLSDPTGRWSTNAARVLDRVDLAAAIDVRLAGSSGSEVLDRLESIKVPAGRVRTLDEVYSWDQTRSQDLIITVDHPDLGPLLLPGSPLRFDDAQPHEHRCPPSLGEHTDEIVSSLLNCSSRTS